MWDMVRGMFEVRICGFHSEVNVYFGNRGYGK